MMIDPSRSYWNGTGTHQALIDSLRALIPVSGSVPHVRRNRALERFRRASNVYYDIFNNGLCNRSREFYPVFRFGHSYYGWRRGGYWEHDRRFYERLEDTMDQIIMDAAHEQGVVI